MSANVRGFHTNVGELTHRFVRMKNADLVFVSETFLDANVPKSYARIKGYTHWIRKDRSTQGGGVAFCYKTSLPAVVLETPIPAELEIILMKIIQRGGRGILCIGCYRPPSQGTGLTDYLMDNLDRLLTEHQCDSVIIVGDLNLRGIRQSFCSLLDVFDLHNHVTFPTHRSGSSPDAVVTDLPSHEVSCSSLGPVGSSDHEAILTRINFRSPREQSTSRTLWQWEDADWAGLRCCLAQTDWEALLQGDVDQRVEKFTEELLRAQNRYVPHKQHTSKPSDQPFFGPRCRSASDKKYRAWRTYKRHPTRQNKERHRAAAAQMEATQAWAREQWLESTKRKLRGGHVGSKQWWGLIKDSQGEGKECTIPPLTEDGCTATTASEKVNLLARHFSKKMTIPDPTRSSPSPPVVAGSKLTSLTITEGEVRAALSTLDETKAVGPDGLSPRVLRRCSGELTRPLLSVFKVILHQNKWPRLWKDSHVVPVHKKGSKSEAKNYRPISLLSVAGKVLEGIIAAHITSHLDSQHLLSPRQFGFRKGRSAADLNLLLTNDWSNALDQGRHTAVLALDIAGAFDRVWHAALVERLRAVGVTGDLLALLKDYLAERHMRVVHNGQVSSREPIGAGVPQGSVLGPLMFNIYINDLLNLVPSARAYADDITVSASFTPGEETSVSSWLNNVLHRIEAWGQRWQVSFAPHKTQVMVVSRTPSRLHLTFQGTTLALQQEVQILGVTYDNKMTFKAHISQLARTAAGKLASLRRISWLLDARGRELLYKSQVRSSLEYSCLAWGGAASSHLGLLDKIQRRAERIIRDDQQEQVTSLHSLQHRRNVAGLTVLYKAQQERVPHLIPLCQPCRRSEVTTRAVTLAPAALKVPRSNTSHHQRQFVQVYVRWWNKILASDMCPDDPCVAEWSVQKFKVFVNKWLSERRDSDTI